MKEAESGMRNRSPTRASGDDVRKLPPPPARENGVRNRSRTRAPRNGVRKLSPFPTRSSAPEQRKPSASPPPPPRVPRWLILDRIVHRSRRHCGVVENDATASALANDCVGRPVRASLRIAEPPAVSRLYLHWTGRPAIAFAEPTAIAAHRNSILFRMCVPFEDPMWWSCIFSFPIDYFVYSSSSPSSAPTLTLLPPCFDGGSTDPKSDKYFQPYRNQQQRTMLDKEMGILCHGEEGEFTVADLTKRYHMELADLPKPFQVEFTVADHTKPYHREVADLTKPFQGEFKVADLTKRVQREVDLCLLHHPPPGSAIPIQWSVKRLQIPPDMKIDLRTFRIDVVVPIGSRRLCWVDYYQGMLLIDVLTADSSNSQPADQQLLQFIPLPSQTLKYRRPYMDCDSPDPFRCVCVTDAGIIKLVCILTRQPPFPGPFTITTWILHNVHRGGEWRKDVDTTMGAKEFFGLFGTSQSCLPLVQPSFPMVSLVDPDVICFLLKDEDCSLFWMIEVNMRSKKLQSSAPYINEEEEEGYPPKRGRRNYFFGHSFIPSKFSCYLSENAITSRELSEKMQEAKKERVVQKIGLEAKFKK